MDGHQHDLQTNLVGKIPCMRVEIPGFALKILG